MSPGRKHAWPEDTPLRDKLDGDLAALRRTAAVSFLQSLRRARLAMNKKGSKCLVLRVRRKSEGVTGWLGG